MHTDTPANSIFDGPLTNMLSVRCILVEGLSSAQAKRGKSLNQYTHHRRLVVFLVTVLRAFFR